MDSVLTLGLDSVLLLPKQRFLCQTGTASSLDSVLPLLKGSASSLQMRQRPSPSRISVLPSAQPQEGFLLLRYASETAAALLLELKDGTQKNLTRAGTQSPPKLRVKPENLTRAGTRSPPRLRVRSPTGDTRALNSAADRLNNRRAEADKV